MKVIRYYLHNYFAKYVVDLEDDEIVCDFRNLLRSYRLKYKWDQVDHLPEEGACGDRVWKRLSSLFLSLGWGVLISYLFGVPKSSALIGFVICSIISGFCFLLLILSKKPYITYYSKDGDGIVSMLKEEHEEAIQFIEEKLKERDSNQKVESNQ